MVKKKASSKKPPPPPSRSNKAADSAEATTLDEQPLQTVKEQQRILGIFQDAFGSVLSSDEFPTLLQEIKQALFNREFSTAFGREEYLEAYAARWSPTRALGFVTMFLGLSRHLNGIVVETEDIHEASASPAAEDKVTCDENDDDVAKDMSAAAAAAEEEEEEEASQNVQQKSLPAGRLRMLSIGGCAAEHLAFASYLATTSTCGDITLLDSAPWSSILTRLQSKATNDPPLSKYASASARASNKPLLALGQLTQAFLQKDVLSLDQQELPEIMGTEPLIVTMMFTLNELYTSSGISKTTKLLKNLGHVLPHGSLLLVVDSPGSYSEAAVGKEKKKYPMHWLLNHTLVNVETPGYKWETLESNESVWFRIPEGLFYPISLENMRYQIHLYRVEKET